MKLNINGQDVEVEAEADTPLLWVLREQLGMTGTKFGCGVGQCGACTVHLNGQPIRSCILPASALVGQALTTIEGLEHPVQEAWITEQVPQCGYCQSGQLMAAASLLNNNRKPSDEDIGKWMTNLCRCATYDRIRKGIHTASKAMPEPVLPMPPAARPEGEPPEGGPPGGEAGPPEGETGPPPPADGGVE